MFSRQEGQCLRHQLLLPLGPPPPSGGLTIRWSPPLTALCKPVQNAGIPPVSLGKTARKQVFYYTCGSHRTGTRLAGKESKKASSESCDTGHRGRYWLSSSVFKHAETNLQRRLYLTKTPFLNRRRTSAPDVADGPKWLHSLLHPHELWNLAQICKCEH